MLGPGIYRGLKDPSVLFQPRARYCTTHDMLLTLCQITAPDFVNAQEHPQRDSIGLTPVFLVAVAL